MKNIIWTGQVRLPKHVRKQISSTPCIGLEEPFDYPLSFEEGELDDSLSHLPGVVLSESSGVTLNCASVAPHTDDYVGLLDTKHSLFIVTSFGRNRRIYLHVEDESIEINPLDNAVIFCDRKLHSVVAANRWKGCAIQVKVDKKKFFL